MKTYQKLNRFPLGAIHAEGFLKQQMEIGKNGMTGHLYELEPDMIATPYINKAHVDAWTEAGAAKYLEITGQGTLKRHIP